MPILPRTLFWSVLIGWNTILWRCWFAWRVRKPQDWWQAAALGTIVLNLPIPAEVALLSRVMGGQIASTWPAIWLYAALISVALVPVIALALPAPPSEPYAFTKGVLWRAGARQASDVQAVVAEDHYCRIFLHGERSTLVHARFSDVVTELLNADGLVVRRGHWVAAGAVTSVARQNRKWVIEAAGQKLSVAASCVSQLRRSGWI
ncbi:hypothetical protein G7077_05610 [Sphingomonas piscis]|uniref:HTH LytTR-type domain-containing protein n=1 Tax=Sphingomonas piscis TaxID=2714943 RepID=A0A6G7YNZ1_9SPHN|nr:hypothetical protein [Sphingomonas piscis]QIK78454.1 hypothetical protein G7077_05610 [Sphingomonas piscis]